MKKLTTEIILRCTPCAGLDTLNDPLEQLSVCDLQIEGKRGPGRPQDDMEDTYRETVVSGNSSRLTLVIGMCGDPM